MIDVISFAKISQRLLTDESHKRQPYDRPKKIKLYEKGDIKNRIVDQTLRTICSV